MWAVECASCCLEILTGIAGATAGQVQALSCRTDRHCLDHCVPNKEVQVEIDGQTLSTVRKENIRQQIEDVGLVLTPL